MKLHEAQPSAIFPTSLATMSEIYPKISLLPVLSPINTIASFFKVIISDFQFHFDNE